MGFIDLHCDTLMRCYEENISFWENKYHIDLKKLKTGSAIAQCMAIFLEDKIAGEDIKPPRQYFDNCYKIYREILDKYSNYISEARCVGDLITNKENDRISLILTIENATLLNNEICYLDKLYELGVRMMTLVWNYENCIGFPQSNHVEKMKRGLKPFGIEVVERMNKLGMIVDVSHLSEGGFYDVAKYSEKPFVASHSCSRALCDSARNLTDDQLMVIGESGGVCGIAFVPAFLKKDSVKTNIDDIVKHAHHIKDKAGIDAVAIGSDFDGMPDRFMDGLEFKDYSGMPKIAEALSKSFTADEVDKICYKNAYRIFKNVIG
ncbi:dipeptidase [Clostridiaceae bacterium M8S5]|nr:dipeptidase [Clostridiaceae bacterium M8S5]